MSTGELQSVTIVAPNQAPPAGHDEAMIALAEGKPAPAAAAPEEKPADRPAWLPEKFKSVEEMAASYKELEKRLGAPKAPEVAPPAAQAPATAPTQEAASAAAASAGLDMRALSQEFAEKGALSEASLAALAAKGFDKATVDTYIAGQQALASAFESEVKAVTPGGAEKYSEMVEWAKVNLSEAEIAAYNTAMNTSNKDQAKLAVAGLGARFAAAVGNEPVLSGGRGTGVSGDVFESIAQMKAAMSNPLYKSDPAFRKAVQEKLGRSSIM